MTTLNRYSWYQQRAAEFSREVTAHYEMYKLRLESFNSPNWPSDVPVAIQELANAGFYYTDLADRVKCHCCRGVLYNWVAGDNAFTEHQKHFPQCEFIKRRISTMDISSEPIIKPAGQADGKITLQNWRVCEAVQTVKTLNVYSDVLIEHAVATLLTNEQRDSFDSSQLLDAIFQIESNPKLHASLAKNTTKIKANCNNIEALQREIESLKDELFCKICMNAKVSSLLVPCRHLVCCTVCVDRIKCCPICRAVIVGTIDTFCS